MAELTLILTLSCPVLLEPESPEGWDLKVNELVLENQVAALWQGVCFVCVCVGVPTSQGCPTTKPHP